MPKSNWKQMTEEQKQQARDREKEARVRRKLNRTPEQIEALSQQRKEQRRKRQNSEAAREVSRQYRRTGKGWFYSWANSIKYRAKELAVPCNIDAEYLQSIYTDRCPVFDVEFERRSDRRSNSPYAPTVDRIVPELGYVRGNIIIVSRRANNIKSDATIAEIQTVAKFYENITSTGGRNTDTNAV